jgi:cell division protein FtsZ
MVQLNRQFDRLDNSSEPIFIKVIGLGGAGSNVLDRVVLDGIEQVELVAINTDVQSLAGSVAAQKVQLGRSITRGLGSGGDPEIGLAAAEEAAEDIRAAVRGATVVFLCVGLGGGTGSGAAPLIAEIAKSENALVLVFATLPFSFEGRRRCLQANDGLEKLRSKADAIVCFENDRMAEIIQPRMGVHEAFAAADLTISQSIRSLAGLLQKPGLIRLGFDDICAVLRGGDTRAVFGYGEAEGENRAHDALSRALKNPLMNRGSLLADAYQAIVHIRGGANITLGEIQIIMEEVNRHINDHTQLYLGIATETRLGSRLAVSIVSSLGQPVAHTAVPVREKVVPRPILPVLSEAPSLDLISPAPPAPTQTAIPTQSPSTTATNSPAPEPLSKTPSVVPPVEREREVVRPSASAPPPPKKVEAKQETLQFEPLSRGRFEKSEPTIIDGQDLDVPTFLRKQIR